MDRITWSRTKTVPRVELPVTKYSRSTVSPPNLTALLLALEQVQKSMPPGIRVWKLGGRGGRVNNLLWQVTRRLEFEFLLVCLFPFSKFAGRFFFFFFFLIYKIEYCLTDLLTDGHFGWLMGTLVSSQALWLVDRCCGWLRDTLVGWRAPWLVDGNLGWLVYGFVD